MFWVVFRVSNVQNNLLIFHKYVYAIHSFVSERACSLVLLACYKKSYTELGDTGTPTE